MSAETERYPTVLLFAANIKFSRKKLVWLCRGHGRVFYVNTCTLTGNIFFQRIICMS
jgi:hypothetical protein